MILIEAYSALKDPNLRRQYDLTIKIETPRQESTKTTS